MSNLGPSSYRNSAVDLRRLSLFLAVVDHGGFSRAAQAVHISQPALSQAIAELETELGGPLFHRLGRGVSLTAAGTALVGPARSILRELDAARQVAAEITGLARGRLDLSALRTVSTDALPHLLGRFLEAHPNVEVRLASPDDPGELVEQVRSGEVELGITVASDPPSGLTAVPLGEQHLQIVLPPGTARQAGTPVTPAELAGVPLVVTPRGSSARELLEDWLSGASVAARVSVETSQREAIVPLVLAGAGAALVPEASARLAIAAGAVAAQVSPPLVRALVVVHRSGTPTPAAREFLRLAGQAGPD